jgi:Rab-GTPase-TBC domain
MIGSMVDQSVLAIYCERLMPRLYAQFARLEYPISLVLCKWMNCLFWLNMPAETAARIMDLTLFMGSDALLEVSLSILSNFQPQLCQCEDLQQLSALWDSVLPNFYPTPANMERLWLCLNTLDRRELVTMRHRVHEMAEGRLRDYSTTRTLDRLRHLGSLDEKELAGFKDHWSTFVAGSKHKEGMDLETFHSAVTKLIAPAWAMEPALLDALFAHVNKSRTGSIALTEWVTLIEALSSRKGKLRLLYGMCGDRGDPVRTARIIGLLSVCWRGDGEEVAADVIARIAAQATPYSPEDFVRLLKTEFPELVTSLSLLAFGSSK